MSYKSQACFVFVISWCELMIILSLIKSNKYNNKVSIIKAQHTNEHYIVYSIGPVKIYVTINYKLIACNS